MDIGKHFIVGLKSCSLDREEIEQIEQLQPLGFIFFSRNFNTSSDWQNSFFSLVEQLKDLVRRDTLVLSIDHEGGRVNRLPLPVTAFPYARDYEQYSEEVAEVFAKELTALGFNLCFAPVLDIDLEPTNTVIAKRAFGTTASTVSERAITFAKKLELNGILSCGKHFPGHGATIADSHFELPVNNSTTEELLCNEIKPFEAYVNAGFKLIMSSHILFPKIDAEFPATLSKKIVNDILKEKLKFQGCVISDDLDMKALDNYPNKGLRAIEAGIDVLLIGGIGQKSALSTATELAKQIAKTNLTQPSIRINKLLMHLQTINASKNTLKHDANVIGCIEHQKLLEKIKLS